MTLTDAELAELAAIAVRDAGSHELWFSGPHQGSFTAQAAKDRRVLLELVHTLLLELESYPRLPDAEDTPLCPCGAFAMHDGRVLHASKCRAGSA